MGADTGSVGWRCPGGSGREDVEHELKCCAGLLENLLPSNGSRVEFC
jgi:hypothetical protein